MIGLILGLLTAICVATSFVLLRRAVYHSGEVSSTIPIFSFVGLVFFGFITFISGEISHLTSISWLGIASLAGAGVTHFIFGRILGFTSIRLIGANRAAPIHTSNILIAVVLGFFFLEEPFYNSLLIAVILIFGGIVLISTGSNSKNQKQVIIQDSLVMGVLTALGAALCWGVSPVLVKIGLKYVESPFLAAFVSYATSSLIMAVWLSHPRNSEKLRRCDRSAITIIIIAAAVMALAHLLRYTAFKYSALTMVQPLMITQGLFVFPLSFLINREIEAFGLRIIFGAIAVVAGVFLIFWTG